MTRALRNLCLILGFLFLHTSFAFSQSEEEQHPRILIYSDAHRDYEHIGRMFRQARGLDIDYIIGLGDLTEGRSLAEVSRSYKYVARQLWWLSDAPWDRRLGMVQQSRRWIEFMGNKEDYGFLRIDRKNFGRQSRMIVGQMALVPDARSDEGHIMDFNGFKIYASHMPVSKVPEELRETKHDRNWRNLLWPPSWPLPGFSGPEASTLSSMRKDIHPEDVDLVVYGHLHVAAHYPDPKTGILVVSPGSASKNKSPEDQRTASFIIVDTSTRLVTWHDISKDGEKFRQAQLDSPKFKCPSAIARISRPNELEPTPEPNSVNAQEPLQ